METQEKQKAKEKIMFECSDERDEGNIIVVLRKRKLKITPADIKGILPKDIYDRLGDVNRIIDFFNKIVNNRIEAVSFLNTCFNCCNGIGKTVDTIETNLLAKIYLRTTKKAKGVKNVDSRQTER